MPKMFKVKTVVGQNFGKTYGDLWTKEDAEKLAEKITIGANEAVIMTTEDGTEVILKSGKNWPT